MDVSPTRRRTLQLGAVGVAAGLAGCLGDDQPDSSVEFDGFDRINDDALPSRTRYATSQEPFAEYRLYEAADPDTALILLHTAVFDSRILEPLATALTDANVAHVITPDLRGHGPDPETRGDIHAQGQLEDDVRKLVDRVERMYPDVNILVGGHGTGGGVIARFASTPYGELVDGTVLLAPYLGRGEPTTRPAMGGWANFYGDRIFMLRVFTGFGLDWSQTLTTVEYDIPAELWDGTETLEHTYRLMASYTPPEDVVQQLVDNPTLTVVGADDETAYPDAYEELFGTHSSATVEQIDGASYFDLTLTETAVETIETWIAETDFD